MTNEQKKERSHTHQSSALLAKEDPNQYSDLNHN